MSLFGLFHTIFGLGALGVNAIDESINDTRSRERAKKLDRDTYLVNGYRLRSTKTGRDAVYDRGITKYDHTYIRDRKTGQIIEDVTLKDNAKNQIKEKDKAKKQGRVFYRTTKFDTSIHHTSPVYVSDTIPGYFKPECMIVNGRHENIFSEGRLVEASKGYSYTHVVEVPFWEEGLKSYFDDGSIYTICVRKKYKRKIQPHYDENGKLVEGWEEKEHETWEWYKKGERYE